MTSPDLQLISQLRKDNDKLRKRINTYGKLMKWWFREGQYSHVIEWPLGSSDWLMRKCNDSNTRFATPLDALKAAYKEANDG